MTEEAPLGTGGAIRNVLGELTADTILVFNGDVLGGTDVRQVLDTHRTSGAASRCTWSGCPIRVRSAVPTDDTGRVTDFLEDTEPADRSDQRGCVRLPAIGHRGDSGRRPVSVEREVFPGLLSAGRHIQVTSTIRTGVTWGRRGLRARLGRPGARYRTLARAR